MENFTVETLIMQQKLLQYELQGIHSGKEGVRIWTVL